MQHHSLELKKIFKDLIYLIKIGKRQQTKLLKVLIKKELKHREELFQARASLDLLLKQAPERERKHAYSCYCKQRWIKREILCLES